MYSTYIANEGFTHQHVLTMDSHGHNCTFISIFQVIGGQQLVNKSSWCVENDKSIFLMCNKLVNISFFCETQQEVRLDSELHIR